MISSSARATTAAEARFRVARPNAGPRAVAVVSLDEHSTGLAADLATRDWNAIAFYTMGPAGELRGLAGESVDLDALLSRVEVVQMLLTAGERSEYARALGDECLARGVKTSGLVIDEGNLGGTALTRSLEGLRASVMTLSVLGTAGDVVDVLQALGG